MPSGSETTEDEDAVNGDLPASVRELVASVRAKAREMPTPEGIRALAAEKTRAAHGQPMTLAQINALADAAIMRIEKVTHLMTRLAELTGSGHARA